jgi:hypothetical protein
MFIVFPMTATFIDYYWPIKQLQLKTGTRYTKQCFEGKFNVENV